MSAWLQRVESNHRFVLYQGESQPDVLDDALPASGGPYPDGRQMLAANPALGEIEVAMRRLEQDNGEDGLGARPASGVAAGRLVSSLTVRHRRLALAAPGGAPSPCTRRQRARDHERLARLLAGRATLLTLGGGGARGLAHIGVFKALHECNVPVDAIAGTSAGCAGGGGAGIRLDPRRDPRTNRGDGS